MTYHFEDIWDWRGIQVTHEGPISFDMQKSGPGVGKPFCPNPLMLAFPFVQMQNSNSFRLFTHQ